MSLTETGQGVLDQAYHHHQCKHNVTDAIHWCAFWGRIDQIDAISKLVAYQHIQERVKALVEAESVKSDNAKSANDRQVGPRASPVNKQLEHLKAELSKLRETAHSPPDPDLFRSISNPSESDDYTPEEIGFSKEHLDGLSDSLTSHMRNINEHRQDLLMLSAVEGNAILAAHLVKMGIFDTTNCYNEDDFGMTALEYAAQQGHLEIASVIATECMKDASGRLCDLLPCGRAVITGGKHAGLMMSRPLALARDMRLNNWEKTVAMLSSRTYELFDPDGVELFEGPAIFNSARPVLVRNSTASDGDEVKILKMPVNSESKKEKTPFFRTKSNANANIFMVLRPEEDEQFEVREIVVRRPLAMGTLEDEELVCKVAVRTMMSSNGVQQETALNDYSGDWEDPESALPDGIHSPDEVIAYLKFADGQSQSRCAVRSASPLLATAKKPLKLLVKLVSAQGKQIGGIRVSHIGAYGKKTSKDDEKSDLRPVQPVLVAPLVHSPKLGPVLDLGDTQKKTPICCSCRLSEKDANCSDDVLVGGARVYHAVSSNIEQPIKDAITQNEPGALLWKNRAEFNFSSFHIAVCRNSKLTLKLLWDRIDQTRDLKEKTAEFIEQFWADFKLSPLHVAAATGHIQCLEFLLDKGLPFRKHHADVDQFGATPLHYACAYGRVKCADQLIEVAAGQEISGNARATTTNVIDAKLTRTGHTAMACAVEGAASIPHRTKRQPEDDVEDDACCNECAKAQDGVCSTLLRVFAELGKPFEWPKGRLFCVERLIEAHADVTLQFIPAVPPPNANGASGMLVCKVIEGFCVISSKLSNQDQDNEMMVGGEYSARLYIGYCFRMYP